MNISKKTIIIAIIVLLLVAGLTTGILIALKGFNSSKTAAPVQNAPEQSAADIVTAFSVKVSKGDFSTSSTLSTGDGSSILPLYVSDAENGKFVQLTTTHYAILTNSAGLSESDLTSVTNKVKKFLEDVGLSAKTTIADGTVLASYASKIISCQFSKLEAANGPTQTVRLLCADSYAAQLSSIRDLIGLWPTHSSAKYDVIIEQTITKEPYVVTILRAYVADFTVAHNLVFVKTDGSWKYIGDAGEGEPVVSNERYVINKDIKAGLDNPQYGSALLEALSSL